jgi:hypothetical protein
MDDGMVEKVTSLSDRLSCMASVDVRTVDTGSLVDIADVKINKELPKKERVSDYIRQIGNPYCYISHGVVVKLKFTGEKTLEDCLAACVSMEA